MVLDLTWTPSSLRPRSAPLYQITFWCGSPWASALGPSLALRLAPNRTCHCIPCCQSSDSRTLSSEQVGNGFGTCVVFVSPGPPPWGQRSERGGHDPLEGVTLQHGPWEASQCRLLPTPPTACHGGARSDDSAEASRRERSQLSPPLPTSHPRRPHRQHLSAYDTGPDATENQRCQSSRSPRHLAPGTRSLQVGGLQLPEIRGSLPESFPQQVFIKHPACAACCARAELRTRPAQFQPQGSYH